MSWEIDDLVKGAGDDCHIQFVEKVRDLAIVEGWTSERNVSGEWIGKSTGLSTVDEIYVGIKAYQDAGSDYYNVLVGTFSGYDPEESFETQPGGYTAGVPAHNLALGYYLSVTLERIAFCLRMGSPVYMHGYMGKFKPYSTPGEYPYPVLCMGMLDGPDSVRYSDDDLRFPYKGVGNAGVDAHNYLRNPAGSWDKTYNYPFSIGDTPAKALMGSTSNYYAIGTNHSLVSIQMTEATTTKSPNNLWGEVEGVFGVSGFGITAETILQEGGSGTVDQTGLSVDQAITDILAVGGRAFIVLPDADLDGFNDFIALEMS